MSWLDDLADAQRRLRGLDAEAAFRERRGAVATWRHVEPFSTHFLPLPAFAQDVIEPRGDWSADGGSRGEVVGFDERGRPVAHVLDHGGRFERAKHLWWWEAGGGLVELELMGSGPHLRRARFDDAGRLLHVATASVGDTLAIWIVAGRADGGVRLDGAEVSTWQRPAFARARAAVLDCDGRLVAVRQAREAPVWLDEAADGDAPIERLGLEAAVGRAHELTPEDLLWDGRLRAPEPWPGREAGEAMVEPLAHALAAAVREAAAASSLDDAFVLVLQPGNGHQSPAFPGTAVLGHPRFRERMAAMTDEAVLGLLWRGTETGDVVELDLTAHLDDDAMRMCRILSTALGLGGPQVAAAEADRVAGAVGDRLAVLLHDPPLFEGCVALVRHGPRYEDPRDRERAVRVLGAEAVAALDRPGPRRPAPPAELLERALTDRGALEELLRAAGLTEDAARLAHEVAAEALLLEATDDARSRLGGPPLLPPDAAWPTTEGGAPLSFLAGLDLAELDELAGLPGEGWLLFFAALDPDEDGLVDVAVNEAGSAVRVLFCTAPAAAEPPGALRRSEWGVLDHRPVRPRRVLTLPDGWDAGREVGLDVFGARAYEAVLEDLRRALDGRAADREDEDDFDDVEEDGEPGLIVGIEWVDFEDLDDDELAALAEHTRGGEVDEGPFAHHWVSGHATGVRGHPPQPGTVLLLHLETDADLRFEFLDGGTIQFRIPSDALAARDWSAVVAFADSC
jgi:hypothetical protein